MTTYVPKNNNGKWQLAFWVVTFICGAYIFYFNNALSAHQRLSAAEYRRIERVMLEEDAKLEERLLSTKDLINEKLGIIMGDLREIKTRMGIKSGKVYNP